MYFCNSKILFYDMTNAELKKQISEAPEQEWFKTVSVTFNFSLTQHSFRWNDTRFPFQNISSENLLRLSKF